MKNVSLLVLLSLILFSNCNKKEELKKTSNFSPILINISDDIVKESILDIVDYKYFIPLKNVDSQDFIGKIDKVISCDDYLYVLDKSKSNLLKFSRKGNFINKIGQRGKGPGEYTKIDDFIIDEKEKEIYLLSINDIAVFKYDLNGKFIKKIRFDDFYPQSFALQNDKLIFDTGYNSRGSNENVIITNRRGRIIKELFKYPGEIEMSFEFTGGINNNGLNVLYAGASSPIIYGFDENLTPFKKYIFDLGENGWKDEDKYNLNLFMQNFGSYKISFLTNEYIENNNSIIFQYFDRDRVKIGYYSFETEEVISYDNIKQKELIYFFNMPKGMINEYYISYADYESYSFLKNEHKNSFDNELQKTDIELFNTLKNLSVESNPILIVYDIKK